jgi:adenylate cyclase class 2
MGYKEAVRINKTRVITHYNGCEICIDEVEGLGSFIEMEKLAKEGDSEKIQEELFEFFKRLGITNEDRVFWGYDTLMLSR